MDTTAYCDLSIIGNMPGLTKLSIQDPYSIKDEEDIMPLARLNKLTVLKLFVGGQERMVAFLKSLRSAYSLEELDLWDWECSVGDEEEFMKALSRFTRLRKLFFSGDDMLDDILLPNLHSLKNLHTLSIRYPNSITSRGLLDLVGQLPHLEELILQAFNAIDVQLQRSTYLQICAIYRSRNQKLIVYNIDKTKRPFDLGNCSEPFGDCKQHDVVKYI